MLQRRKKPLCRLLVSLLLATTLTRFRSAAAADVPIECRFVYETADGVYVNAGSEAGLVKGQVGRLEREDGEVARVEVVKASSRSGLLRLLSGRPPASFAPGERLTLFLDRVHVPDPPDSTEPSPTLRDRTDDDEPFVPLLAPRDMGKVVSSDGHDLFHGSVSARQLVEFTSENDLDALITYLRSAGSVERLRGTPWTLEWSGGLSYRDGDALEHVRDYQDIRVEFLRLAMFRRFDDRSMVRFGRFLPRELPSVGFLDGAQGEKVISESFRLGGMLGFKPTRENIDLSFRELTGVFYGTFEAGEGPDFHYSGTAGVLASLYRGTPDRLALLVDQTVISGRLSIFSTSEVDLDMGGADSRDDVARLTRLGLVGSYHVAPILDLRAGLDKFERPDTEAERDALRLLVLDADEFFDRGYWRYWVGGAHELFWDLRLAEEVSVYDSANEDYTVRGSVSLTRTGLPYLPAGSLTLTVYNLRSGELEGYGGRVSAYLPFLDHRLSIQPSVAFRLFDYSTTPNDFFFVDPVAEDFEVTDVSVRAHWFLSRSWQLSGGVSYANTIDTQRFLVDLALTFRW